ncbi:MAG: hypothetical protein WBF17_14970, partial [Phycisphaerae bacterium]
MASLKDMGHATIAVAVLLAGALFGGRMAQAATWQQRAAGTYRWADANNWAPDVPNAAGAHAKLDVGLQGGIAVTLDRAITIGTLRIKASVADAISDTATVSLDNTGDVFFGVIDLDGGINETVGGLRLGGVAQPAGTYGSSASAATHKPDRYFTGPG